MKKAPIKATNRVEEHCREFISHNPYKFSLTPRERRIQEVVPVQKTEAPLRILHVYRQYFPDIQGGVEETIRQICLALKMEGVENRVFTLSPNPDPAIINRPEADVFRSKRDLDIASCSMSFRCGSEFQMLTEWADLIHYHFPWPFGDFLHLCSRINKPAVVTYHSDIVRHKILAWLYQPLMYRFLSKMIRIFATSPNYFASSPILGKFSEKVEVIPLSIDRQSYPEHCDETSKRMREIAGNNFFLFVGMLRYYKGLHILIDAIKNTSLPVVIVGAGPMEKKIKARARRLGLNNVIFLGHVSDQEKVALIKLSRAIVFPSYLRSEAFGMTLIEGAMYGKPLISNEIGTGTSYVNINEETGLVIEPCNSKALRQAMMRLAENPLEAKAMGKRARARYELLFSGSKMRESYLEAYRSVVFGGIEPPSLP